MNLHPSFIYRSTKEDIEYLVEKLLAADNYKNSTHLGVAATQESRTDSYHYYPENLTVMVEVDYARREGTMLCYGGKKNLNSFEKAIKRALRQKTSKASGL